VSRGDTLTITPAGAVGLMCNAIVTVLDEAGDFVGQIIQGEFRARNAAPEPTYPACLDSTPPGPHSFTIPNATPTGALVMCIAEATQAEGCARVTVAAATAPTTTTAPGDPCWSLPLAPPSLPDGSAPGDPELSDAGAHWGSPPNMVTQFLGDAPQEVGIVEAAVADGTAIRFGAITAAVAPVGDDPLGQKLLEFIDNRDGCVRTYNITVGIDLDEAKTLALRWAIGFWTGEPAGDPTPTLGLSVYGAVYDVNDVQGTFEFVGVTEFAADGSSADATDRARASLDARHRLPGGGVLTMDMASGTSCGGMFANRSISVIAANGSATTLHPDLLDARSFVVSGTGSVFTTRLVCPDGAEWGSPGTYEELLRFDPASSTVEVLATYPAEPQVHRWITAVGPQERYAAFRVAYALEHSRYEVVDLADPLTPIDLPTTCPVGRNLVGPPQFLDGAIVVARRCAEPGDEDRPEIGHVPEQAAD